MKKVIILNSPPFGGKDEGARWLKEGNSFGDVFHHKEFKRKLIEITQTIFDISPTKWENLYTREKKEKPSPLLGGKSPREALIFVSEEVIKPKFGKDYFGVAASRTLEDGVNVFSDGGFIEELRPLVSEVGVSNILIVRIFREGCSFEGDSRNYLPDNFGPLVVNIHNNGTLQEYHKELEYQVGRWLRIGRSE